MTKILGRRSVTIFLSSNLLQQSLALSTVLSLKVISIRKFKNISISETTSCTTCLQTSKMEMNLWQPVTVTSSQKENESYVWHTNKCGHIENTCRLTSLGIFLRILNLSGKSVVVNRILFIEQLNNCKEDHLVTLNLAWQNEESMRNKGEEA